VPELVPSVTPIVVESVVLVPAVVTSELVEPVSVASEVPTLSLALFDSVPPSVVDPPVGSLVIPVSLALALLLLLDDAVPSPPPVSSPLQATSAADIATHTPHLEFFAETIMPPTSLGPRYGAARRPSTAPLTRGWRR